jgi:hypothetical protein
MGTYLIRKFLSQPARKERTKKSNGTIEEHAGLSLSWITKSLKTVLFSWFAVKPAQF